MKQREIIFITLGNT